MTNIDDSTQTPPGYWFGVIEGRLHERMREALADLGLRRGSWRILHTLADGPATADELAERLPHGGPRGERAGQGRGYDRGGYGRSAYGRGAYGRASGHGMRPGWRGQEPRDEHAAAEGERSHQNEGQQHGQHDHHGHDDHHDHHDHHGHDDHHDHHGQHDHHGEHDHGDFERAFERGYERGFDRGFAFGAVRGGHPAGPFPGGHGYSPFPGWHASWAFPGRPFAGGRRGHRIHRVLADFVERGWVWFDGDRATLTDEGRAAHDTAFERVQTVRAELANGIPEGDFEVTLATLETMARNLGWRPAAAPAGGADSGPDGGQRKADADDGAPGDVPNMDA